MQCFIGLLFLTLLMIHYLIAYHGIINELSLTKLFQEQNGMNNLKKSPISSTP